MAKHNQIGSAEVTNFLNDLQHPFNNEIEQLRKIILSEDKRLVENIKWNAPNYSLDGNDRITMRIHPPKQIQLIFHRGAKVQEIPKTKLINDTNGILIWKTNDRAVATFADLKEIKLKSESLKQIINLWLKASA